MATKYTGHVKKIPCWLFLVIPVSTGQTELRGIATERWIADSWRKAHKNEPKGDYIRMWIEERELNHCFGNSLFDNLTAEEGAKINALEKKGIIKRK